MRSTTHGQVLRGALVTAFLTVTAVLLPLVGHAGSAVAPPAASAASGASPSPGRITLAVESARSLGTAPGLVRAGDPITSYKWLINRDDTGDPGTADAPLTGACLPARAGAGASSDPDFADSCPWPSIRRTSGFAPIVAQGDETSDVAKGLASLPGGKYLVSVTADGFKIDGAHFTVDGGTQKVTVRMNPTPLPLATLKIQVFADEVPVDSTYEAGAERPLAGFVAHLTDVFGPVSVDYYGNAICTVYRHEVAGDATSPILFQDGKPVVDTDRSTGVCKSDADGVITIPNMGPNRYGASVSPPAGQQSRWVQTTTLEGGRDWDIWAQEGDTGFDNEATKGAELVPMVQFGFARPQALTDTRPTGGVKGTVIQGLSYIGGAPNGVNDGVGFPLTRNGGPVPSPWLALSDLGAGDQSVYVGQGAADGSFDIAHVPDGTYQLSIWDENLDFLLYSVNVDVVGGQVSDVGNEAVVGWFSHVHGHVFVDDNANGKRDPGEKGVPGFTLTVRERDNSTMDQAVNTASTDDSGSYDIREAYPLGKWLVLEAFNTRFHTTGITYHGENEPDTTTKLGSLVDLDFLPIIGLGGEVDWGVAPYDAGTNGGIAGTISYDTTRNELDPAQSASESYQPGIPDVPVHLYASVPCTASTPADECSADHKAIDPATGALRRGPELADSYTSETWAPPRGCTAYDYQGQPLTDQKALPAFGESEDRLCLEAPMMGLAIQPSDHTPDNASQTVNGNYAFATSRLNLWPVGDVHNPAPAHDLPLYADLADAGLPDQDLRAGDYIVAVDIPDNPVGGGPMYHATGEKDVNVFDGDSYLPQENLTHLSAAQGSDPPAGAQPEPAPPVPVSQQAGIIAGCAGPRSVVHVTDQAFLDGGGSPFEGQSRPSCDAKLVTVRSGQTTAPNFTLFTDVPIPTHFWGLTLNDLGLTYDQRSVNYGEALGIPDVPVGLYDWSGRLMDTVHTDFNGMYEGLEPSTSTYNCPVPAGPCPNMYRFVGNDPGQPGHLNADYNPRYRTIAASFQGWPGLFTVTDEAPTQVAQISTTPDGTQATPAQCDLGKDVPQLYAASRPYVRRTGTAAQRTVTLSGRYFGATPGRLRLGSATVATTAWSDETITFVVPAGTALGGQPLSITRAGGGASSVNTITLQVIGSGTGTVSSTNPRLAEVGPGRTYPTIQAALEAAVPSRQAPSWLVVVWPGAQTAANPRGEYTENVIVHHRVRVQGVGPGGFAADGHYVPGSVIDGLGFNPDNQQGADWIALLGSLTYSGAAAVPDGATVTVLDDPRNRTAGDSPAIDGFTITGGVQQTTPTNINLLNGGVHTPYGAAGALVSQGGGIYVHERVTGLSVTNDVIRGNGGSYAGGIRVGTPYAGANGDTGLRIDHNQIRDNGGTNLAGGIGIFAGNEGYAVTWNALCGNHSAEYGGAMTAYGWQGSSGGSISHNRIWFNGSYDEGGGVMVAGELPANPDKLSPGTGPVSIDHNVISTNIANDDGGGIRLLQTSGSHVTSTSRGTVLIADNDVVDNISAHEGGGIALDDSAFVDVVDNTVARNLTTATAVTSNGQKAPAGLSSAAHSAPLQARLAQLPGAATAPQKRFSDPTLLDNLFWDNRAGTYLGGVESGIGLAGADDVDPWDMGLTDLPTAQLSPRGSVLQTTTGTDLTATDARGNRVTDAVSVVAPYEVSVDVLASRTYPAFRQAAVVAQVLPPDLMGDWHLLPGTASPAYGAGTASTTTAWGDTGASALRASSDDLEGTRRPTRGRWDAGADQLP